MRDFHYVFYGKIDVKLDSFLHIGGETEETYFIATNGNGEYIIPASGIAGAVKSYFNKIDGRMLSFLGGDDGSGHEESITYFYDSICQNVNLENRKGIRIDGAYGVTEAGSLHSLYYIGAGMTAQIRLQAFLKDEKSVTLYQELFDKLLDGIWGKQITLGAKKSNGAGVFKVQKAGNKVLNLADGEDLDIYLAGVESVFDSVEMTKPQCNGMQTAYTRFVLYAEIPDGLIVIDPLNKKIKEGASMYAVNVSKQVDGKRVFYIPGSSIKGIIRGYAKKVCNHYGKDEASFSKLFGGASGKEKFRSHVLVQDVVIKNEERSINSRIKIDRWLGSIIIGAEMNQEVVATKEGQTIKIEILTDLNSEESAGKTLNGLVFLALRDMAMGLVPIGSASSIGFGRLRGKTLSINNETIAIDYDGKRLEINDTKKEMLNSWLREVENYK